MLLDRRDLGRRVPIRHDIGPVRALLWRGGDTTVVAGTGQVIELELGHLATPRATPIPHRLFSFEAGREEITSLAAGADNTLWVGTREGTRGLLYHVVPGAKRDDTKAAAVPLRGWVRSISPLAPNQIAVALRGSPAMSIRWGEESNLSRDFADTEGVTAVVAVEGALIGGDNRGRLRRWPLRTARPGETIEPEELRGASDEWIFCVAATQDQRYVVAGDGGGRVIAVDLETAAVRVLHEPAERLLRSPVRALACAADNRTIVAGGDDGRVLWLDLRAAGFARP